MGPTIPALHSEETLALLLVIALPSILVLSLKDLGTSAGISYTITLQHLDAY